jgi:hypothetical protein
VVLLPPLIGNLASRFTQACRTNSTEHYYDRPSLDAVFRKYEEKKAEGAPALDNFITEAQENATKQIEVSCNLHPKASGITAFVQSGNAVLDWVVKMSKQRQQR